MRSTIPKPAARVVMYTAVYCPWCWRAKSLLERHGIQYEEKDVTANYEERKRLIRETGRRTVPNVFLDGASIGGFDELSARCRAGRDPFPPNRR
jgi:glutaredoxin 3